MKTGIAKGVGLLVLGLAGTDAALAQVYVAPPPGYVAPPPGYVRPAPVYRAGLPPHVVARIVRSNGLAVVTRPVLRSPRRYVVIATDAAGQRQRVVVNAFSGQIVRITPVYAARPGRGVVYGYSRPPARVPVPPGYAVAPPGAGPEIKDPPPGARNPGLAGVPHGAEATHSITPRSKRTPLPRPRPKVAMNAAEPAPAADAPPPAAAPAPAEAKPAPVTPAETSPEAPVEATPSKPNLV
ncbi:MAG: hypothetical protein ACRECO_02500, partial [Xanthobacteraceae bacterium]